ncbi:MAG: 4-alpha-glucanotransferase [Symbiobacteriaceae bacterium]|nr:4-alpha-glucanotransferase [Symbiobacteriaceae bacterium]
MLPGPFGIGVLGKEAREFVDFLATGGFSLWQMLPLEHMGASYSPYKAVSAFAGEPMYIDPRWLYERGWVTEVELRERWAVAEPHKVNYELIYDKQMVLLRAAFARLPNRIHEEISQFNPFWLDEYALYMAIKEQYHLLPWFDWSDSELQRYERKAVENYRKEHRSLMAFYRFVQWLFDLQWQELHNYAQSKGVLLMGDIPIYVSEDSAEVWSHREMFATDKKGNFLAVAGAPPDYFNTQGQRWGNPLYNWELMAKDNYTWWVGRMRAALEKFDLVRIDHFRGFESYWHIPVAAESAREGYWVKGPGVAPFKAMVQELGPLPVIAEDLGDIGPEVEALLEEAGFPGIRVLQFGFLGDERHLPHNYSQQKVAYSGTHDNTTLLAWIYELRPEDRETVLTYCGYEGDWSKGGPNCGICRTWIRLLYTTPACWVIIPIQDLLGYGGDTRTNIPGNPEGNWRFRVTKEALAQIDTTYYRRLATITQRLPVVAK